MPSYVGWNDVFLDYEHDILNFGVSYRGIVGMDLTKDAHAFIAGETGSGKSNLLKCLIYQSLKKQYGAILIDFKRGVSFSTFSDNLLVYYDYESTKRILEYLVSETNRRLDLFREAHVDNLTDYNRVSNANLKRIIVFVDELAELLKTRDKELSNSLYDSIETLTRISRAAGVHLVMGIQRPDAAVINGQIKNNVSFRICGRFVDKEPSRIMLNCDAASHLPNTKGRFIVKDTEPTEFQSFLFLDGYVHTLENDIVVSNNLIESNTDSQTQNKNLDLTFDFSDIK